MEYWDLYDKNRQKLSKIVKRGEKINDGEYHLVVNAWIKNDKNEFLITQRSEKKSHPLMWECTGGSVIKGEKSIDAALREVKEELGINVSKDNAKFIGSTCRYYKDCPDILDVFLFESNVNIDDVVIQKDEVCNVIWASSDKIKELFYNGKFEANAFFEKALGEKEKIYYIGFNANNAICNEDFFEGSITLYPNKEKGNIYYSNKYLLDTKSEIFLKKYKKYIYNTCKKIQSKNHMAKFICFNEKITKLCSDMNDINLINYNNKDIQQILNDKFKTRDLLKEEVPIIDYSFILGNNLNYDDIKNKIGASKFVIQGKVGAGGNNTYLIEKADDICKIENKNLNYCISKYIKHIPLNITLIIGEFDTIYLPISAQLISLTNNKYKYVGADFIYPKNLSKEIKDKLLLYSEKIAKIIKKIGYRGILGIDFILSENDKLYFMEVNPRFQASSFLISLYLKKYCHTDIAELHYLAIRKKKIGSIYLENIDKSFLNCNDLQQFDEFLNYNVINNGYFKDNKSSYYRKIFDYSIISNEKFENIE